MPGKNHNQFVPCIFLKQIWQFWLNGSATCHNPNWLGCFLQVFSYFIVAILPLDGFRLKCFNLRKSCNLLWYFQLEVVWMFYQRARISSVAVNQVVFVLPHYAQWELCRCQLSSLFSSYLSFLSLFIFIQDFGCKQSKICLCFFFPS